jgi:predicted peptidase
VKFSRRRFLLIVNSIAVAALLVLVVGSGLPVSANKEQPVLTRKPAAGANAFVRRVFTNGQGQSLAYYLYVPYDYSPERSYPLVLVLHGGGEHSKPNWTAAQNRAVILDKNYVQVWEPGYAVSYNPQVQQHWPAFVVVPQLPQGQQWVNVSVHGGSYRQPAQPATALLLTKELLAALQKQYSGIDANRLYITGISLGGYGVWDAIERWPDYFAAAIPIAGAGDPSKAAVLVHLPIWAFQGSKDQIVPISGSRNMIAAIRAAGGHPLYTEYPGAAHEVWPFTFSTTGNARQNTPGVLAWLFAQHK